MVAIGIGSWQLGLAIAGLIAILNMREDKVKRTIYIDDSIPGSISLIESGHYFCPSHCAISHVHRAHKGEYNCSHPECDHMIYDSTGHTMVPIIKVKKRKTGRTLPFKSLMPDVLVQH